ncbi:hypothetical protein [Crocosphaera sp.]|uniref:hypothetical protein n=1 Tax=Crocosphaera sp. TaxID=2729996 RepID=UPI002606E3E9|nr:hypothetical protein [Crocosphaera sp.]MDJ0582798.1 hypothetical protein [Crocosphaera sp.]
MGQKPEKPALPLIYFKDKIILPFNQETFNDFIVSLLGKPQNITRKLIGSYIVDSSFIKYIDQYLDHIINEFNTSSLIEFSAIVSFNDDSSISFNSIDELLEFNQYKSLLCTSIALNWIYLVNFPKAQNSRKQQINISMITNSQSSSPSQISYSIEYTSQQWGIFIGTKVNEMLETLINKENKKIIFYNLRESLTGLGKSFLQTPENIFYLLFIGLFVFVSLFQILFLNSKRLLFSDYFDKYFESELKFLTSEKLNTLLKDMDINDKLDLLIGLHNSQINEILVAGKERVFFISLQIFIFSILIISFLAFIFSILQIIKLPNYGFILLTDKSVDDKDKYFLTRDRGFKKWSLTAFISIIMGIFSGIIGNYIYTYLINL